MKSEVSVKGQTVVPREIRKALGIKPGTTLTWSLHDQTVLVTALAEDPVEASFGALKDYEFSSAQLLTERQADRDREEKQAEKRQLRWQSSP